jgi:hypothetical protein
VSPWRLSQRPVARPIAPVQTGGRGDGTDDFFASDEDAEKKDREADDDNNSDGDGRILT